MDIVLATTNMEKVKEFKVLFKNTPINLLTLDKFDPIDEIEEDGETFEDNAFKKAMTTAKILNLPAIADDSGLLVDALDGRPGVYSARYASENATYEENCDKLLKEMEHKIDRSASFQCAIAIAVPFGTCLMYRGKCNGYITEKASRSNGFGYDPVFFSPEINNIFSEVSIEIKNTVSHRSRAFWEIKEDMDRILFWVKCWTS